jgi:hypothetical protein
MMARASRRLKVAICVAAVCALAMAVPAQAAVKETLKLVIGTPGKTGCLVCHGDPSLAKFEDGKKVSLFINPSWFDKVHSQVTCIDCHTDFTFKSVKPTSGDWRVTAGTACKNCHDEKKNIDHRKNYADYRESIHGRKLLLEGNTKSPTCAGCHGSHRIRKLSETTEMAAFRKEAYEVCGKCHKKYWDNYNDWFHGKAYKHGAPDSPPCWDCHEAHKILPSKDPNSPTNLSRVSIQCEKCHKGADRPFAEYGKYIHGRNDLIKKNLVMNILLKVRDILLKGYDAIRGLLSPGGQPS